MIYSELAYLFNPLLINAASYQLTSLLTHTTFPLLPSVAIRTEHPHVSRNIQALVARRGRGFIRSTHRSITHPVIPPYDHSQCRCGLLFGDEHTLRFILLPTLLPTLSFHPMTTHHVDVDLFKGDEHTLRFILLPTLLPTLSFHPIATHNFDLDLLNGQLTWDELSQYVFSHQYTHINPPYYSLYQSTTLSTPYILISSGQLTWDELSQYVFSRDDEELNSNIANLWRVRNQLAQVLVDSGTPFDEWRKYLDTLCRHFAKVHQKSKAGESPLLDINGFFHFLLYLKVPVTSIEWRIDRLIDWLIDWMINWLIEWLIEWLTDWFIDWLIDWLIEKGLKMLSPPPQQFSLLHDMSYYLPSNLSTYQVPVTEKGLQKLFKSSPPPHLSLITCVTLSIRCQWLRRVCRSCSSRSACWTAPKTSQGRTSGGWVSACVSDWWWPNPRNTPYQYTLS